MKLSQEIAAVGVSRHVAVGNVTTPLSAAAASQQQQQKVAMLRQALDGNVDTSERAREQFIDDFLRLCIADEQKNRELDVTTRLDLEQVRAVTL